MLICIQKLKGFTWSYSGFQCTKQKEYLFHKYELLKDFCNAGPKLKYSTNGRSTILHPGYMFYTRVHYSLDFYGNMFYKFNSETCRFTRSIPVNIEQFLTPRAIAYWYMDDGYLKWRGKSNAMVLCTDSFHLDEVNILRIALKNLYNIETQLNRKDPKKDNYGYRISINEQNSLLFRALIKDYVLESMNYKLQEKNFKLSFNTMPKK